MDRASSTTLAMMHALLKNPRSFMALVTTSNATAIHAVLLLLTLCNDPSLAFLKYKLSLHGSYVIIYLYFLDKG